MTPSGSSGATFESVAVAPPRSAAPNPRLRVQLAAASTKRRHFVRAVRRIGVLGALDLLVLVSARSVLGLLREASWSAAAAETVFPTGFMDGWGSVAAMLVGLAFVGAYASEERWGRAGTIVRGVALGAALAMWQSLDTFGVAWTVLRWILVSVLVGGVVAALREGLRALVVRQRLAAKPYDKVILVGDPDTPAGRRAKEALLGRPGMQSLGWLSERVDARDYLGHPSAVWEVLCESGTDTVLLCEGLPPQQFDAVVEAAAVSGCRVLSVHDHGLLMATQPRALNGGDVRMLELTFPAARAGQDVIKRLFDILSAGLSLLVLSPLLATIAIWIRLDSRGPVFFVQERVGQAGRTFPMLKFRTMRTGADQEKAKLAHLNHTGDSRLFKIPNDPRITRVGEFLRRWSLDELPQLVNVLRGDMSMVGPRPFFESDLAAYDDHHFIRLAVKPGITGLWQVKGRSSIVDFEEVVQLDRKYVEDWSLGLDLSILIRTVPAVAMRRGAY